MVYLIFAFALIWIAFANIIGKKDDVYEMKRALPRFAVGILMVPFSWFFVQLTLSITAILTVSMLSLPFNTFESYPAFQSLSGKMCTHFKLDLGDIKAPSQDQQPQP